MTIRGFLIIIFLSSIHILNAQEQLGLRFENYSGINSVLLNPANTITYPLKWDLNLASVSLFADNNYAYFQDAGLADIANNSNNIHTPLDEWNPTSENLLADFYRKEGKKYISTLVQVTGPSLMIKINEENNIGFFTNFRTAVGTHDIPANFGYYQFEEMSVRTPFEVAAGKVAAMAWSEVGLTYSHLIYTSTGYVGIGGNLKILNGYEGAFAHNKTPFETAQINGDTIQFDNPDMDFGYTSSNIGMADGDSFRRVKNGGGVAIDLGFTYVYEGVEDLYKLKLGASLLDFGSIRFSRNAGKYRLNFDGIMEVDAGAYSDITNPDSLVAMVSQDIYNDVSTIKSNNSFGIWLPAALSVQADYLVFPMFYVNGVIVQRIPTPGVNIKRNNLLAIAPRFEHRWFAGALSLSLVNYQHFNVVVVASAAAEKELNVISFNL